MLAANAELRLSAFTISSMRECISDMHLLGAPTEGRIDSMASSAVAALLGRVDELFDDDPGCNEMNQSQKGLAQFLISCRNTAKWFEVIEKPFHLLA